MGAPQFTPGPWTAERDLPHNRLPRVHGGDHSLICEVGNMGTLQDQWEANARLIAAAPELYEALAEIVGNADELDIMGMGNAFEKAIAALAKVRGEQ